MNTSPVRQFINTHDQKVAKIRQIPLRGHRKKKVKRGCRLELQSPRPRLLGLPYVVEMCRNILAVLCRNNYLLVHIPKRSRQIHQISQARPTTSTSNAPARPWTGVIVQKQSRFMDTSAGRQRFFLNSRDGKVATNASNASARGHRKCAKFRNVAEDRVHVNATDGRPTFRDKYVTFRSADKAQHGRRP